MYIRLLWMFGGFPAIPTIPSSSLNSADAIGTKRTFFYDVAFSLGSAGKAAPDNTFS